MELGGSHGWLRVVTLGGRSSNRRSSSATIRITHTTITTLASLRSAVEPLMDAGKALVQSGEFLIDLTTAEGLYGGTLLAAGAQICNAGDCITQATASCCFKMGTELVVDELHKAAICLQEATIKVQRTMEVAQVDECMMLAGQIGM